MITVAFITAIVLLLAAGYATGSAVAIVSQPSPPLSPSSNVPVIKKPAGSFNYVSDASLTGQLITNVIASWPGASTDYPNDKLWDICTAVALAEGYQQGLGTAPYDLNNPGDLGPGDEAGQAVSGPPQFHGGSNVVCFATVEGGFIALYTKFDRIVNGRSSVYAVTDTWTAVAAKYAGDKSAWLANVTNYLGVDMNSIPADYVNS